MATSPGIDRERQAPSPSSSLGQPGQPSELGQLSRLGEGGSEDRLGFRLVVAILWRCLHLLTPVRSHVAALCAGFTLLAVFLLPPIVLGFDVFWTRALQGEPLTSLEATILSIDPAVGVDVAELTQELRSQLVRTVVIWGAVLTLATLPLLLALFYYRIWILQRVNQLLRVELLERLQSLSLRFHDNSKIGDALYRLYQDSSMVTQLVDVLFLMPLLYVGRFVFSVAVLAVFDLAIAAAFAGLWIPTLAVGAWYSRRLRVRFRTAREANSLLTSSIQETLAGIRVIKAYRAERFEQRRFERRSWDAFHAAFSARNLFAVFQVVCFWVLGSVALAVITAATLETRDAKLLAAAAFGFTAWNLGLYNVFKFQVGNGTDSVRDLLRTWGRVQDIVIGLDRVFEILDLEPEVQDAPDAVALEGVQRDVAFREVHFAYQPDRPVLRGVTLSARVGTITAIVGPTGSGKTTLMALLLRLFDPSSGRVEIDGVDLRRFHTASVRDNVSVALQENILFGDTVRANIKFATPNASDAAVREAARVACACDFIEALPEGYDTLLGERGTKLSTGQRQRISIARALLKDSPILILDEPTASLDAVTELEVLRNLAQWGRGRAIFLITHRLSTIRRADQIACLRDGRLLAMGSHSELMQMKDSPYRDLVESERTEPAGAVG